VIDTARSMQIYVPHKGTHLQLRLLLNDSSAGSDANFSRVTVVFNAAVGRVAQKILVACNSSTFVPEISPKLSQMC
jgi:hypothetical protein